SPENPKRVEEFVPASDRARTSDVPPSAVVAKTTARFGSAVPKPTGAGLHRNDQVRHEDSNSSADSDLHLDATRELATDPQAAERPLSHPEAAAMEGYRKWAPEDFTP